jgi:NAD(P)-dependent dehydrogenase (short-subunit alcohol dehydrogenase family)
MTHPAFAPGHTAVVTGGASGIGLAAATRFASLGMAVIIADLGMDRLAAASDAIIAAVPGADVTYGECDVANRDDLVALAQDRGVDVLMNNAAISPDSSTLDEANWHQMLDVNLWGVINGTQAFVPHMIARDKPGLIINTGSKQGITTPPGNPAYNVAKAGVKAFTEALQHELRNTPGCQVSAHLLIPGFVWTGLTRRSGRTEKPDGAWTAEQTVDFMMDSLETGDFYILCPDNDVSRALDEKRIAWAAGDIIENRPPLSRWHPAWGGKFKTYVDGK